MASSYLYKRHSFAVRIMHWVNVIALAVLLMSGLQIFNAHPHLYWGKSSYDGDAPWLSIEARLGEDGKPVGVTRVFDHSFDTTGVLGVSHDADGRIAYHAFPSWATIPSRYSLSSARQWHFLFAWLLVVNGLLFVGHALLTRHLQRDLAPSREELAGIGESISEHLRFRHARGEAARRYNVLQKLTYLAVIFLLLPLMILMGWAMSPALNALFAGWVDLVGGRQSARTIHFVIACLLFAFVLVHVFEVLISGVWNQLRSMVTGNFRIDRSADDETRR